MVHYFWSFLPLLIHLLVVLSQKETRPQGRVFLFGGNKMLDSNPSKCGADERRRRRLDGAAPLFSFTKAKENANRVLLSPPKKTPPK